MTVTIALSYSTNLVQSCLYNRHLSQALSDQPQEWKDSIAEQIPLRRNAQPEDIAGGVLLLTSEPA